MEYAVSRVLEQHEALVAYFKELCESDPTTTQDIILWGLEDPMNKNFLMEFMSITPWIYSMSSTLFISPRYRFSMSFRVRTRNRRPINKQFLDKIEVIKKKDRFEPLLKRVSKSEGFVTFSFRKRNSVFRYLKFKTFGFRTFRQFFLLHVKTFCFRRFFL